MINVTTSNRQTGDKFWLRGTIWTADQARAQPFADEAEATAALQKAMRFSKPRVFAQRFTKPAFEEAGR